MPFITNLFINFFVSMGMVLGGTLCGGIAATIRHMPPTTTMLHFSDQLKIWAMVSTLGGTMDTLRVIDEGLRGLQWLPMGKQFAYLAAAFLGCQAGALIIRWLAGSELR